MECTCMKYKKNAKYPKYDIHYGIKKNEINFKYFDTKSN